MSTIDHQPARPVADDWDWQLSAVCRGMDVDAFYHPAGERLAREDRADHPGQTNLQALPRASTNARPGP